MDDSLLDYYERELTFIREMGAEFARKYPKIAGRILLAPDKCDDPHTERLIEAFAFLCARVHRKIDDDLPEMTESLLSILYPHYLRPIPSMTIFKFEPIRQAIPPVGYAIEKNTPLYSQPVNGNPCRFTTSYPVTLWPVEIVSAELQDSSKQVRGAQQVIVIQLKTFNGLSISDLTWQKLRFFLSGPHQHIFHLYELLFNNVCHIECEAFDGQGTLRQIELSPDAIKPVGFEPDENVLPYSRLSFPGYLSLFEYFCFPEKFLFFDLLGLAKFNYTGLRDTLSIRIYFNTAAKSNLVINNNTFCLNAAPALNLFHRIAEPIRIEHRKTEYHVIPDIRRQDATEVFSIDRVTSSSASVSGKEIEFRPFYSIRHHLDLEEERGGKAFWHAQRRSSGRKGDDGTEIYLSFVDLTFNPVDPGVSTVTVYTSSTNRDLPGRLPFGNPSGDFNLETTAPVGRVSTLIKPTMTRRSVLRRALQWRLISHLSLNYLSVVEEGEEALREILRLYDFDNSPSNRQQIEGIVSLKSRYVTRRIGQSVCRGVLVGIEFDETKFVGSGLFLFASVLERFLAHYVSVNSFSQLVARTTHRMEPLKQWPPRSGNRILM